MLRWDQNRFHKKCGRTHDTELVFLRRVGAVGHVVHTHSSGARNIDVLFSMLRWAQCSFDEKHTGKHYTKLVFLHMVGSAGQLVHSGTSESETSMHYFSCSSGTSTD
jgi:hypothetical protein